MALTINTTGCSLTRFVQERIQCGRLTGEARSVAELALNNGVDALNKEQAQLFEEHVIGEYGDRFCRVCGEPIPLDEAIQAVDFFLGCCSSCAAEIADE